MMLGNVYSKCVCFHSGQGATMQHGHPAKRSNTVMDENKRAMDILFLGIMGI